MKWMSDWLIYSMGQLVKLKFGITEKKLYICIINKIYGIPNRIFTNSNTTGLNNI